MSFFSCFAFFVVVVSEFPSVRRKKKKKQKFMNKLNENELLFVLLLISNIPYLTILVVNFDDKKAQENNESGSNGGRKGKRIGRYQVIRSYLCENEGKWYIYKKQNDNIYLFLSLSVMLRNI